MPGIINYVGAYILKYVLSLPMNIAAMLAMFKISIGTEPVIGSVPLFIWSKMG